MIISLGPRQNAFHFQGRNAKGYGPLKIAALFSDRFLAAGPFLSNLHSPSQRLEKGHDFELPTQNTIATRNLENMKIFTGFIDLPAR